MATLIPTPVSIIIQLLIILLFFIFLGSVVLGLGRVCAKRAENKTQKKPQKWFFLVVSFFFSTILYLAIADLARIIFRYQLAVNDWSFYPYDQLIKKISARMVVILLDFPVFAWVWYQATVKTADKTQEKSELMARSCFLRLELFVFGSVLFILLGTCLYNFFNWILGVGEINWTSFSGPFSYAIVTLSYSVFKLTAYFSAGKRLKLL
ncbi:MAG TPA: DUF5671 domain-containing protein [Candidatus Bathyarchaeia archaeon]|nr:DUF5671 domain-containing protein [Candidatus Bathyarchaeia archaeon]